MSSKKKDKQNDPVDALHRLVRLIDCLPFHHQLKLMVEVGEIQDGVLILMQKCTRLENEKRALLEERIKDLEETVSTLRLAKGVVLGSPDDGEKN